MAHDHRRHIDERIARLADAQRHLPVAARLQRRVEPAERLQHRRLARPIGGRAIAARGMRLRKAEQSFVIAERSEERRVGKASVSPSRSRWSQYHKTKKTD